MLLNPSVVTFVILTLTSSMLLMSSPSMLVCWVALELNTLGFIPLMAEFKNKLSSESCIKYFLVQTFASVVFILASFTITCDVLSDMFLYVLFLSLAIKLGAAPFQSWVLSVSDSLPWFSLFLLLTVQKVNPFILIISLTDTTSSLLLVAIMASVITGAVGGLNQTSSRGILVFSSINHLGWLLAASMLSVGYFFNYFLLYSLLLVVPLYLLSLWQVNSVNQMNTSSLTTGQRLYLVVGLLSLGGLPPFLGFLPKWLILQSLLMEASWVLCVIMVLSSVFTLYFYLRLSFSGLVLASGKSVDIIVNSGSSLSPMLCLGLLLSSAGLPLMFIL